MNANPMPTKRPVGRPQKARQEPDTSPFEMSFPADFPIEQCCRKAQRTAHSRRRPVEFIRDGIKVRMEPDGDADDARDAWFKAWKAEQ